MWLRHSQETAAPPGSGERCARIEWILECQLSLFIHSFSELRVQYRAGGGGRRRRTGGCVIHYRKKAKKERRVRAASHTGGWLCRSRRSAGLGPETVREHRAGGACPEARSRFVHGQPPCSAQCSRIREARPGRLPRLLLAHGGSPCSVGAWSLQGCRRAERSSPWPHVQRKRAEELREC